MTAYVTRGSFENTRSPQEQSVDHTRLIEAQVETLLQDRLNDLYEVIYYAEKAQQQEIIRRLQEFSQALPGTIKRVQNPLKSPSPRGTKRRRSEDEQLPTQELEADVQEHNAVVPDQTIDKRRKRGRVTHKKTTQEDFAEITLSISETCTVTDLTRIRKAFYDELLSVLDADPKAEEVALHFTSFFFEEVMGRSCLERLVRFCKGYSTHTAKEMDAGAVRRLLVLASDRTNPASVRKVYSTLHGQETSRAHKSPLVQHLDQLLYARRLSVDYRTLLDELEGGDSDLIEFFAKQGFEPKPGHGWASVVVDLIVHQSGVARGAFNNTYERSKGVDQLVKQFGEGILPLLPPGSMNRLRRFGNARVRPAYDLLRKHVASFQPICDMVKQHIFDPFVQGMDRLPIMAGALSVSDNVPFLQALRQAVEYEDSRESTSE